MVQENRFYQRGYKLAINPKKPSSNEDTYLTEIEIRLMPPDKLALLKESVSVKKSKEDTVFKGEFELYDDSVVLKISHRFSLSSLVRSLPPTFPGVEMREPIPFSRVTGIGGRIVKGFLSRNVKIELQTDQGVTWVISGPQRILDATQNAYQAWKHGGR